VIWLGERSHGGNKNKMNQKHVFWEALLLAIFIFASGILLGYMVELNRTDKIITAYQESELNLLDIQIQEEIISLENFDCKGSTENIINFADKIYFEAKKLEEYSTSSRLSEGILYQHKKYDLLRAILWMNSLKIKEKCGEDFNTIVYFYEYNVGDLDLRDPDLVAEQRTFSLYLGELKKEYAERVILIPIAGNLEISSIDSLRSQYNIDVLPAVLVNEEFKVLNLEDLDKLRTYLK